MTLHHERPAEVGNSANVPDAFGNIPEDDAMDGAAEALREVEVEAAESDEEDNSSSNLADLERMSIDELRVLAKELDVPDREKITEQDKLIEAIRRRL